jgi:prolyl-tRNA synthetase
MGSYGIGSGRLAATVVEQHHDEKGIVWPASVAPFDVALLSLGAADDTGPVEAADRLYASCRRRGSRPCTTTGGPGGGEVQRRRPDRVSVRVSVSARTLARWGGELKPRTAAEATFVPLAEVWRRCGGCWRGCGRG